MSDSTLYIISNNPFSYPYCWWILMVWERYRLLLPLPTSIVQHGNIRFRASFGFSFNVIALDKQRATSSTRKDGTTSSTHFQQQGPTAPIINLQHFLEINLIAKKIFHDSNKIESGNDAGWAADRIDFYWSKCSGIFNKLWERPCTCPES